ncbi:MAG: CBS domain-containing protein [Lachnospiraceae bacterium]|nr:CBS domain-containing protein [Lachnospiraceae bacterium]
MNIFGILIPKQMLTYLYADDTLDIAVNELLESGYTAVPVIDKDGIYLGVVSEGDFLKMVMECGRDKLGEHTVSEIISKDKEAFIINTVSKDEIMEKILDRNFLSIVDDRKCFVGIITRKSIIKYLSNS